jgi:hypothetical protein
LNRKREILIKRIESKIKEKEIKETIEYEKFKFER